MSTGHIKLWWAVKKQPDSFNIYHSLSPFSPTNLPVPVATGLSATAREFRHLDQEHQYDHYYRIASVKNGRLYVSKGILVRKKPIQCIPTSITVDNSTILDDSVNYGLTMQINDGEPEPFSIADVTGLSKAGINTPAKILTLLVYALYDNVAVIGEGGGNYWIRLSAHANRFSFITDVYRSEDATVTFTGISGDIEKLRAKLVAEVANTLTITSYQDENTVDLMPYLSNEPTITIHSCAVARLPGI